MTLTFTVPGPPQGKARPRFTRYDKYGCRAALNVYTPENTREYEQKVKNAFNEKRMELRSARFMSEPGSGATPLKALESRLISELKHPLFKENTPITAVIIGYFPIPKTAKKAVRELMFAGAVLHTKKIDCDNLAKVILDALNGAAYKDDAQVARLIVKKIYAENPRVTVTLTDSVKEEPL